jgi:hypothetical protein
LYDTAVKKQNKIKLTKDSRDIGILDFYEGLSNIVKIVAVCNSATDEMQEVHKPDNGFISAATDLITFQFLEAELRAVVAESRGDQIIASRDVESMSDSTILGNPEKMLFYIKELCASAEDPGLLQNPFVLTKIDLNCVRSFDFDDFLRSVIERKTGEIIKPTHQPMFENDSAGDGKANAMSMASVTGSCESMNIG